MVTRGNALANRMGLPKKEVEEAIKELVEGISETVAIDLTPVLNELTTIKIATTDITTKVDTTLLKETVFNAAFNTLNSDQTTIKIDIANVKTILNTVDTKTAEIKTLLSSVALKTDVTGTLKLIDFNTAFNPLKTDVTNALVKINTIDTKTTEIKALIEALATAIESVSGSALSGVSGGLDITSLSDDNSIYEMLDGKILFHNDRTPILKAKFDLYVRDSQGNKITTPDGYYIINENFTDKVIQEDMLINKRSK